MGLCNCGVDRNGNTERAARKAAAETPCDKPQVFSCPSHESDHVQNLTALTMQVNITSQPWNILEFLEPYELSSSGSTRTVTETILRSFALHFVSVAAFGHLLSLQNRVKSTGFGGVFNLIGFFFLPTLPLAQLLANAYLLLTQKRRRWRAGLKYKFAAILGVKTHEPYDTSVGNIHPDRLEAKPQPYGSIWLGRIFVLLGLMTQFVGTIYLWYRRAQYPKLIPRTPEVVHGEFPKALWWDMTCYGASQFWPWNKLWPIDGRNFEMAAGGLVAVACSLGISLLNTEWIVNDNEEYAERGTTIQDNANSADSAEGIGIEHVSEKLSRHGIISRTVQRTCALYAAFRTFNIQVSRFIRTYISDGMLRDIETAYFLRVAYFLAFPLDASVANDNALANPANFLSLLQMLKRMDMTLQQGRITKHSQIASAKDYYAVQHRCGPSMPQRVKAPALVFIYFLPSLIILLSASLHILGWTIRRLHTPPSRLLQSLFSGLGFWFRKERTLVYIMFMLPVFFLFFIDIHFHIVDLIRRSRFEVQAQSDNSWNFNYGVGSDGTASRLALWGNVPARMFQTGWFWKDPLADMLYVI